MLQNISIRPENILIPIGGSGSGKGVIGEQLAARFVAHGLPFAHIESGVAFREAIQRDPSLARLVNSGQIPPGIGAIEEASASMFARALAQIDEAKAGMLYADGFYRDPIRLDEFGLAIGDAFLGASRDGKIFSHEIPDIEQAQLLNESEELVRAAQMLVVNAHPRDLYTQMQARLNQELNRVYESASGLRQRDIHAYEAVKYLMMELIQVSNYNESIADRLENTEPYRSSQSRILGLTGEISRHLSGHGHENLPTDPGKLLTRLLGSQVKIRMDDLVAASALFRTTTMVRAPKERKGTWTLGQVGEAAIAAGYSFDEKTGLFRGNEQKGRFTIDNGTALGIRSYQQFVESIEPFAATMVEKQLTQREGREGQLPSAARR